MNRAKKREYNERWYQANKEQVQLYNQRPEIKEKLQIYEQRLDVKARRRAYYQKPEMKEKLQIYEQRPEIKARRRAYNQRPEVKAKQQMCKKNRQQYKHECYPTNKDQELKLSLQNNDWQKMMIVAINKLADDYPAVNIGYENQKNWKPYL